MFWQDVSKLIQRALDINIKLYDLDIIFGLPGEEDIFRIIKLSSMDDEVIFLLDAEGSKELHYFNVEEDP